MTTEEQKQLDDLNARLVQMEQLVKSSAEASELANKRTMAALGTIEDMSTMFAEHVATLDRRMEDIGGIFLSKLEKKVPKMVE